MEQKFNSIDDWFAENHFVDNLSLLLRKKNAYNDENVLLKLSKSNQIVLLKVPI